MFTCLGGIGYRVSLEKCLTELFEGCRARRALKFWERVTNGGRFCTLSWISMRSMPADNITVLRYFWGASLKNSSKIDFFQSLWPRQRPRSAAGALFGSCDRVSGCTTPQGRWTSQKFARRANFWLVRRPCGHPKGVPSRKCVFLSIRGSVCTSNWSEGVYGGALLVWTTIRGSFVLPIRDYPVPG